MSATPVAAIGPGWLPESLRTHTLNMSDRWLATDGTWRRRKSA